MADPINSLQEEIIKEAYKHSDSSMIRLVDLLLQDAHCCGASDTHIDPNDLGIQIRLRRDGILEARHLLPLTIHSELISRLKILAGLRTDEHTQPQDGRFTFHAIDGDEVHIRVSILPTYYGENAVLRFMGDRVGITELTLSALGMSEKSISTVSNTLLRPYGLVLVTGPTGSGKTSTVYSIVRMLAAEKVSVVSIEDPIERVVAGVRQIPVQAHGNFGFAAGLRALLRQDPDVIMVGEIRDSDTARLAVQAALTGHLVLATLHTTTASGAVPRLIDMGIEPYLLEATVRLVIAQRLVRTLCGSCALPTHSPVNVHAELGLSEPNLPIPTYLFRPVGCSSCLHGYRGRTGVFELLEKMSHTTLTDDCIRLLIEGRTSLEECTRIRHE